jgi:allantoinase
MNSLDLILRHGTVITPDGLLQTDVGIADGKIASLGKGGAAREEIDATGLHIFPGVIDSHVHFNEPGRADWEGIETGSHALAAGGGTVFFDMPLNAHPPTCDARSFDEKLIAMEEKSVTDFALWGGLVPGNLDKLERLAARGVVGFKAFMSNSGIEDFENVDNATLREGMKHCAALGKLVAVHAESDAITARLAAKALAENKITVRDYLDSRPIHAELEAIQRAIQFAGETKCALHIVHVSSGAGVALIASARNQGADVTCETCPHYLVLTEDDMEKLGALAKCAPPLRTKSAQDVLWRYLEAGYVNTIGSDHSPSPPDMKRNFNFFKVWGGISGVQHTLPLLLTEWNAGLRPGVFQNSAAGDEPGRRPALQLISDLLSANVAARFKIPHKGKIAPGFDADFALVDLKSQFTVAKEDLFYRHPQSPYVGRTLTGRVTQTILRGKTIFKDGKIVNAGGGKLIQPEK